MQNFNQIIAWEHSLMYFDFGKVKVQEAQLEARPPALIGVVHKMYRLFIFKKEDQSSVIKSLHRVFNNTDRSWNKHTVFSHCRAQIRKRTIDGWFIF